MRSRSFRPRTPNLIAVSVWLWLVEPLAVGSCSRPLTVNLASPDAAPKDSQVEWTSTVDQRPAPEVAVTADVLAEAPSLPDAAAASDVPARTEAGKAMADAEIPRCVANGELAFSPPQTVPGVSGPQAYAVAATANRKLVVVGGSTSEADVNYVDSLDGGRSFRASTRLGTFEPNNLYLALGTDHVYVTSARFADHTSVILWHASIDALVEPPNFQTIEVTPFGAYFGTPVAGPNDQVAMLLGYDSWDASGGEFVSTAASDMSFSTPHKLFWPEVCAAGVYHSNGKLYIVYGLDTTNGPIMQIRWSADGGATFSDPITRNSSGGTVWCPKLYELPDGRLLIVGEEGYALNPPQRNVAVPFDVADNQFESTVIVDEGDIVCCDSARTATGRQFVATTFGDPGERPQGVTLRYSDDGGLSWSVPYGIPGMAAADLCPNLAASNDELYLLWRDGDAYLLSRAGASCDAL